MEDSSIESRLMTVTWKNTVVGFPVIKRRRRRKKKKSGQIGLSFYTMPSRVADRITDVLFQINSAQLCTNDDDDVDGGNPMGSWDHCQHSPGSSRWLSLFAFLLPCQRPIFVGTLFRITVFLGWLHFVVRSAVGRQDIGEFEWNVNLRLGRPLARRRHVVGRRRRRIVGRPFDFLIHLAQIR